MAAAEAVLDLAVAADLACRAAVPAVDQAVVLRELAETAFGNPEQVVAVAVLARAEEVREALREVREALAVREPAEQAGRAGVAEQAPARAEVCSRHYRPRSRPWAAGLRPEGGRPHRRYSVRAVAATAARRNSRSRKRKFARC